MLAPSTSFAESKDVPSDYVLENALPVSNVGQDSGGGGSVPVVALVALLGLCWRRKSRSIN